MTNSLPITVLMPVHNGKKYLAQAIQSILDQTFEDFELLIINDGSTDSTPEIIEQFSDPRILVISNKKNIGLIGALNRGIELAKGRYIARMDCDDLSATDRLAKQWEFMEKHSDIGVCGSWVRAIGRSEEKLWKYPTTDSEIRCKMLFSTPFAHPSVIIRKAVLVEQKIKYATNYKFAEDYELWTRCMDRCGLANLSEPLISYRLHEGNISFLHAEEQRQVAMRTQRNILKKIGINVSEEELTLHNQIGRRDYAISLDILESVDKWFSILASANHEYKYFPEQEFLFRLALHWRDVCRSMRSLGPIVARRFTKSKHSRGLSFPLGERLILEYRTRRY